MLSPGARRRDVIAVRLLWNQYRKHIANAIMCATTTMNQRLASKSKLWSTPGQNACCNVLAKSPMVLQSNDSATSPKKFPRVAIGLACPATPTIIFANGLASVAVYGKVKLWLACSFSTMGETNSK
eukprot:Protomagalhaensia_wolfi_Nauph_80__5619@NODE_642_length_2171_cov_10_980300_g479_i0_p4_GENE_NODE_642_length_2171_cov_10_980300_g479_i0NODE_642_length_2171_cov_10_980300_g479_i0_p4_ORF_typecomplete_len126_score19_42Duffy_binding/PF05424_11/0_034_NODE_642_length_2171_cov_10_980300_g479_i0340717